MGHGKKPIICVTCGKTAMMSSYYSGVQKYCSRECYRQRKTKWSRTFICKQCGKEVRRSASHFRPGRAQFCSMRCRAESRRKGGSITNQGYRVQSVNGKPRLEHHIVMEKILGRSMQKLESVHHKNGDRLDNSPENLELWNMAQPPGQRVADKIAWMICFLEQYGYAVHKL